MNKFQAHSFHSVGPLITSWAGPENDDKTGQMACNSGKCEELESFSGQFQSGGGQRGRAASKNVGR